VCQLQQLAGRRCARDTGGSARASEEGTRASRLRHVVVVDVSGQSSSEDWKKLYQSFVVVVISSIVAPPATGKFGGFF
jgi:hypothetical protein